jgi:hypothetical protein
MKLGDRKWLLFFLCLYLGFSFATYRDYGITCDEIDWYVSGGDFLKHYLHLGKEDEVKIFSVEQASHNYLYPAFLRAFSHAIVPERLHLLNLLFAVLGFAAAYELLLAAYGSGLWALAGPLSLFMTFRFSGDIPANPKDTPFAVLFLACLALIYLFRTRWKHPGWEALLLGSLIGITACVRAIGLTLLPIWALFRLYQYWGKGGKARSILGWIGEETVPGLQIFLISQFWMAACWPYLGANYFGNYLSVFRSSEKYTWVGEVMFMGKPVLSTDLPWYYLPGWFLVTMPVVLLAFFLASWALFPRMKGPARDLFVLLGGTFLFQGTLYLALRPVIYNALRHYLFLVPVFCLMGVLGIAEFFRGRRPAAWKKAAAILTIVNLLLLLVELGRLYPYQYIYFNELVGGLRGADGKFETDYWGASLKEAAEWLDREGTPDPLKTYRVRTCSTRDQLTHYFKENILGDNEMKDPDYRVEPNNPVMLKRDQIPEAEIKEKTVYVVQREGVPLYYVLKMK